MRRNTIIVAAALVAGLLLLFFGVASVAPGGHTTAFAAKALAPLAAADDPNGFTYQGSLTQSGAAVNGVYSLRFRLYDDLSSGNMIGAEVATTATVVNGVFTANLDFGADAFNGGLRYLEIAVSPGTAGAYTALAPRQPLTPAPWALFALNTQGYDHVIVVAKRGGDFTSINAALSAINQQTYQPFPTATTPANATATPEGGLPQPTPPRNGSHDRYLIWVAPGIYEEQVRMLDYVDLEGAGQNITVIESDQPFETLTTADHSAIRNVTIRNTFNYENYSHEAVGHSYGSAKLDSVTVEATGSSNAYGVLVQADGLTLNNVTINVSGATTTYGVRLLNSSAQIENTKITSAGATSGYGVYSQAANATLNNVSMSVTGGVTSYGVYNQNSTPAISDVKLSASGGSSANYGVYNKLSTGTIDQSKLTASGANNVGLYNEAASSSASPLIKVTNSTIAAPGATVSNQQYNTTRIGASQLDGGAAVNNGGALTCAGVYDEDFQFFSGPTCP